ncbi:MAG: hypothetical protein ACTSU3_05025, partial [Candidatus Thorarchaeota archaeon]
MAQTISSIISQTSPTGESYEPIGRLAGFGGLLGVIAGIFGLMANSPLIPVPAMLAPLLKDPAHFGVSAIFLLLLSIGVLIQVIGSKNLKNVLSSGIPSVGYIVVLVGILLSAFVFMGGVLWNNNLQVVDYIVNGATLSAAFLIFWQIWSVLYIDSSESWVGFGAGILNALAFPLLAIGQAMGGVFISMGFIVLIVGQLLVLLYWWSPMTSIRTYARSPDKAKFGFGLMGLVTFIVAGLAVMQSFVTVGTVELWVPWNVAVLSLPATIPPLIWAFGGCLLFWLMLSPRLGKRELKTAEISDDLIGGGIKFFMIFLAAVTIFAAGQTGTWIRGTDPNPDIVADMSLFLTWGPSAIMFLMGSIYVGRSDVVTGLPLVVTGVMMLINPATLANLILIPFIAIIITQALLMFETKTRGLTYYSQPTLTVIITLLFSAVFVVFILGGFGSGPAAIWPTNRWFNITLFAGVPSEIQATTVMSLPILALLIRNVSLVGYAKGRGVSGGEVLAGMSLLFALLIPLIAAAFKGVAHMALTAAAIMIALYAISFILVLSVNLNLAGAVEDTGNPIEGMLLRMGAITGMVIGAAIGVIVLAIFSGFPTPVEVAQTITLLVWFIVSLEVLTFIGWLSAGLRLGMLKGGLKLDQVEA